MKILFALDKYRTHAGGADRLARGVVAALLNAGETVHVVEAGPQAEQVREDGFSLASIPLPRPWIVRDGDWRALKENIGWIERLQAEIEAFQPDRVLTQNRLAPASVLAAKQAGVPATILFHGYRCVSPTFFAGEDALSAPPPSFDTVPWRFKLKWPLVAKHLELNAAAYRAAATVIANSEYAARVVQRFFERPAEVLYPLLDLAHQEEAPPAAPADGPVLFVKPQTIKGMHLVRDVAAAMPETPFLVAGAASRRVRRVFRGLANVELRGWVEDMPALYRQASVLFGPSQIPEPFGRVFVEAALHGVPSVASQTGGIPEAVGPGGVLVPMRAPASVWAGALRQARDPSTRAALSQAARDHAADLLRIHDEARLLRLLQA